MTRDEIIKLAREAGFVQGDGRHANGLFNPHTADECSLTAELERFAALVAAAEREACAKVCEGLTGRSYEFDMGRLHSAAAIRARSNT